MRGELEREVSAAVSHRAVLDDRLERCPQGLSIERRGSVAGPGQRVLAGSVEY